MSPVSLGALGRGVGGSELPEEAAEEAASRGTNSDLRGDETRRGGRGRVPAHTEAKERSVCPNLINTQVGYINKYNKCDLKGNVILNSNQSIHSTPLPKSHIQLTSVEI